MLLEQAAILMQPERKLAPAPTVWKSIRAIILASYFNVLLICIPVSWALHFALPHEHILIAIFSFLAIISLAKLLAFTTDELSIRVGHALGSLISVSLGNAVELIVSIVALVRCEIDIVQSSLVGSILSNLLLVLGTCFFVGGLRYSEQGFGPMLAQTNTSVLTISVIAVLLPSAFVMPLGNSFDSNTIDSLVLKMSRGVSVILLFIYAAYLFFQLFSHRDHYRHDSVDILRSKKYTKNPFKIQKFRRATVPKYTETPLVDSPSTSQPQIHILEPEEQTSFAADLESGYIKTTSEEGFEEPQMNVYVTFGMLIAITALVAVTAEFLVDSFNGLTNTGHISKVFLGIILLPIVGNAAEHVTEHVKAVTSSAGDKLTLSLSVAVGSSIQIALFIIPFDVLLGWCLGKPLTLSFDPLQSIVLFLSVLTVNYTIQDGKSNWLEGTILICLYSIVCVTFWFYPGAEPLLTC
ncbi:Sodium/calcium exchanger protein-domain-containing protein [Boletus edulis BED1]|uniref:Sodium/calcium exchanger protein-domain-containing protein n=1 Tax=Boletus edulis BED1 TaxID=1328754 RepID=A0AAD4C2F1_BOLED|nr:Sodium/calcium exchanger protein-domain-containing protein [Boletus edulis BED1]